MVADRLLGASARSDAAASRISLTRVARAHAFLEGRTFVRPDDVKNVALPVMRHRIKTTYEADALGVSADDIVRRILDTVPSP